MDALGNSVPDMDVAVDLGSLEEVQSCLGLTAVVAAAQNERPWPRLHSNK